MNLAKEGVTQVKSCHCIKREPGRPPAAGGGGGKRKKNIQKQTQVFKKLSSILTDKLLN